MKILLKGNWHWHEKKKKKTVIYSKKIQKYQFYSPVPLCKCVASSWESSLKAFINVDSGVIETLTIRPQLTSHYIQTQFNTSFI